MSLFGVSNEVKVELLLDSTWQVLRSFLLVKLEYFFLGDEYFVVLIFKLFGHSGRA